MCVLNIVKGMKLNMEKFREELINTLKKEYKITQKQNEIYFDTDCNTNPLKESDFTIAFQDENQSFTIISKRTNQINMDENILDLLENDFHITPRYIYCFKENPEYLIYHFCFGKIEMNDKIIEEFKKENAFLRFQELN